MLSIRLLGTPEIALDDQSIHVVRRKSRALVYYLAVHSQPLTRDHLLNFFWPDMRRPAAQQMLRTTLHGLRQALGQALQVDDETLALAPDTEVDVLRFQAHFAASYLDVPALITALDLYRGDFLDNFTLPDTPQFEDWASIERERFQRLAMRGWTALSLRHESNGQYAQALDAIERALAFSPLQEDLQRAALRLHYLAGDRAGAIRRYQALRQVLDEEMGVPPMAETRAVYDAIIKDELQAERDQETEISAHASPGSLATLPARRSISIPQALPFVGRISEMETLSLLGAHHAQQLVLLEGEPGIGKTRLAEEFIQRSGALSLIGKARELEQALPYLPLIDALRGLLLRTVWPALRARLLANLAPLWLAESARLLPELGAHASAAQPAAPPTDESRLWEGIHQLLLILARQRRTILFLDDLQWVDASTLALVGYLVRRAGAAGEPIVYLAATRSIAPRSPLASLVEALTRESRLQRIALTRLTPDETSALARSLSHSHADSLGDWLARASECNPYILSELVRYARENGILRADGTFATGALSASPVVPHTVYTLIQSRLARLSDAARRVLDTAVSAGREFDFAIVAQAAGVSESAALDAFDELRAAGLILPAGPGEQRFAFDHSLTMEVAYRDVGELRHRLLHRRVAEALENTYRGRTGAVVGLIASHFAEGNTPERAAPYALQAAQQAERLAAWKEAIGFYEMALPGLDERERSPVYIALGEAHMHAGEFAQATEAYREAIALAEAQESGSGQKAQSSAGQARLAMGESLLSQSRHAEAIALAQDILAGCPADEAVRAEVLWGTTLSVEGADLAGAADHLNAAAALLADRPNPVLLAQIKFELGSVAAQQGDLERAVSLYRESLALAGEAPAPATGLRLSILARNNLAYHLHLMNDPSAIEFAEVGLHMAQESGSLGLQPYLYSTLGEIALAQNDLDAAERYFHAGLSLAESFAARERIAGLTANLGLAALRRGETALAIHRLSTALASADALGTQHLAAQIRLWLVPILPPAEARARLSEAKAIAARSRRRRLLEEARRLEGEIQ